MKKIMLLMAFAMFAMASVSLADPGNVSATEATTTIIGSRTLESAAEVNATAGNVTKLNVDDTTGTAYWQGFFGNATVAIELHDGTNQFYSWSNANPSGELYFARDSISNWGNVQDAFTIDVHNEQIQNDMANDTSAENLTNTYVDGAHEAFSVGATAIASPSPRVVLSDNFKAVFMVDTTPTPNQGVYVAILNSTSAGYDGGDHDYEVMVPTDGTKDEGYFVYAELG